MDGIRTEYTLPVKSEKLLYKETSDLEAEEWSKVYLEKLRNHGVLRNHGLAASPVGTQQGRALKHATGPSLLGEREPTT